MDLEEILIRFSNEREVLESQGYTSFFPYKQNSLYLFDKMCLEKHFFSQGPPWLFLCYLHFLAFTTK